MLILGSSVLGVGLGASLFSQGATITGTPGILGMVTISALWCINLFGFIKYAASKGYSGWIAFWLCSAAFYGFIVLLLLPDRNA